MLGNAPGEEQVFQFLRGRRAFGDDFQVCLGDAARVAVLQQEAAGNRLGEDAGGGGVGQAFGDQQAEVFLLREDGLGVGISAGRDASSSGRFSATMPPKAEVGSHASALV